MRQAGSFALRKQVRRAEAWPAAPPGPVRTVRRCNDAFGATEVPVSGPGGRGWRHLVANMGELLSMILGKIGPKSASQVNVLVMGMKNGGAVKK